MHDLVVRGRIVTPGQTLDAGWIAVDEGRISAIGTGAVPEAERVHDAGDKLVLPGVVDGQTHACAAGGLPGLEPTTRSALAGGVTTIVDMPYDEPDPVTSLETLELKVDAIGKYARADVALYTTIPRGNPQQVLDVLAAGACAVKISAFESHPMRFPRIPANEILDLLEVMASTDVPVGLHNEDQEIVRARMAALKNSGQIGAEFHSPSRPEAAELAQTAQFLELGAVTGAHVHIVHISTPRGYDLVRRYRSEGARATAEMCVHYLDFDAGEDIATLGNRMKVNPPIRSGVRQALWERVLSGEVSFVSSDHASWPLSGKLTPSVFDAGAGIPGLETLLPAFCAGLSMRMEQPEQTLAALLSEGPARFFGLWPRKGSLSVGKDADIVVLEPTDEPFSADAMIGEPDWSPYDGRHFGVRVASTFLRGKLVYDAGRLTGVPGDGRFIPRSG